MPKEALVEAIASAKKEAEVENSICRFPIKDKTKNGKRTLFVTFNKGPMTLKDIATALDAIMKAEKEDTFFVNIGKHARSYFGVQLALASAAHHSACIVRLSCAGPTGVRVSYLLTEKPM